ncbi:MAG: iron-containing alcohol dehydrogenase [Erythrobacter sp.]|uniref:iron-containing alcohol dehydrogenase n=1 Tax=Erythrobacter sp. TaxID=1042 RepID=UPI002635D9BF|nr:iron-containing alcohol dehydrogenase [Erythrobacter sp.]MDJ0977411.1 iron-containing alcohol dehydrogenase [Erythrobacter sp.]
MATLTYLTTTHFDFGALETLPKMLAQEGITKPLIATDAGLVAAGVVQTVLDAIGPDFEPLVYDGTPGNPTEEAVKDALKLYTENGCDGIVALGGGSSMDLGKAVGLLAVSGGPLEQYDPLVGGAKRIKGVAPLIAVPTTSGTGSEVSIGFVIILEDGRKMTFASPHFIPKVAICDPELTMGLPAGMTAATGMDAITHCIEAFLTPQVNPPAEGIALDGLRRGWEYLPRAVKDGSDRDARWHMMMCSTEGALAFVKGLGAVHAMSHAAGRIRRLNPHHGTLNAVFLPAVLRFNQDVCEDKYVRLREAIGLPPGADLAEAVEGMNARIAIPSGLAAMGIEESDIPEMVEYAQQDLAARSNPRRASAQDYEAMIRSSL